MSNPFVEAGVPASDEEAAQVAEEAAPQVAEEAAQAAEEPAAADATQDAQMADAQVCRSCLQDMQDDQQAMACGHVFHGSCIKHWQNAQGVPMHDLRCPVCRRSARELDDAARELQLPPPPPAHTDARPVALPDFVQVSKLYKFYI